MSAAESQNDVGEDFDIVGPAPVQRGWGERLPWPWPRPWPGPTRKQKIMKIFKQPRAAARQ